MNGVLMAAIMVDIAINKPPTGVSQTIAPNRKIQSISIISIWVLHHAKENRLTKVIRF